MWKLTPFIHACKVPTTNHQQAIVQQQACAFLAGVLCHLNQPCKTCLKVPRTPKSQQRPKKEKSGFAILSGALLHLMVLLGGAWGSWTSQYSMPMMPLYHHHISHESDATGLPPPPCALRHVLVICDVLTSTACQHAKQTMLG